MSIPLSEEQVPLPEVGEVYEDRDGRLLSVERVRVNDSSGREITGTVLCPGESVVPQAYATNREIWAAIWYRKPQPPLICGTSFIPQDGTNG